MTRSAGYNLTSKFAILFFFFILLLLCHLFLLRLPYFWDEAGYYIPAAHDLFVTGDLIPHSTIINPHPPLVMAYLALAWKIFGYAPLVTRTAMLLIAAFGLWGVFSLARSAATLGVAIAATACVAIYPVYFAQSSLAHADLAAAAFTIWGLLCYLQRRSVACVVMFTLATLAKETAIIAPLVLLGWEVLSPRKFAASAEKEETLQATSLQRNYFSFWLLVPLVPLAIWFVYIYLRTGNIFGNAEFFRYNVSSTLRPLRILFAFIRRLWQLAGHMNLYVLTLAAALAMFFPAQSDSGRERERIAIPVQLTFAVVIGAYVIVFSLIGGAALARYMLPVVPLVIIILVSTIRRRIRGWSVVIALVCAAFVLGLFYNPPYVFAPEDNLAYRDYILLHEDTADYLAKNHPHARVLTAWPASDELSKPFLGYVTAPHQISVVENFTPEELRGAEQRGQFDVALIFSLKYEPPHRLPAPEFWRRAQTRFFGYVRNTPPDLAARILGGEVVYRANRGGQWVAVIAIPEIRNARFLPQRTQSTRRPAKLRVIQKAAFLRRIAFSTNALLPGIFSGTFFQ